MLDNCVAFSILLCAQVLWGNQSQTKNHKGKTNQKKSKEVQRILSLINAHTILFNAGYHILHSLLQQVTEKQTKSGTSKHRFEDVNDTRRSQVLLHCRYQRNKRKKKKNIYQLWLNFSLFYLFFFVQISVYIFCFTKLMLWFLHRFGGDVHQPQRFKPKTKNYKEKIIE